MSITRLLIYSIGSAILFSEDQHSIFVRRDLEQVTEIAADARDQFIAGLNFGLLNRLNLQHCMALGLVMLGTHTEMTNTPSAADLILYTEKWIADQQQTNNTILYQ